MYYIQLLNKSTSFKSMFIKPYFRFKTFKTVYNIDLNKLKALLLTLKVP
jgi:hypothetical protein